MTRTGRRPGESGTSEAILDAAVGEFAEFGYERATIRGIARRAGVDPALVHHYFKNKEQVFVAAMRLPFNPAEIARTVIDQGFDQISTTLVKVITQVWEQEENRLPFVAMIRSAASNEQAATMVREFVSEALVGQIAKEVGLSHARLRATLVGSQIVGMIMLRYIVKVEPLASAPLEQVLKAIEPTIERYLTGDLGFSEEEQPAEAPEQVAQAPELPLEERRGSVK